MCFCSCRKWSALLKIQRSPSSACATIGTTRRLDLWPTTASISASRDREWNKSRYSHICPVYSFQYRWCLSRCANTNQSFAWQTCVFFNARAWRFSALSSCTEVSPDCQNLLRRLTVDDNIRKLSLQFCIEEHYSEIVLQFSADWWASACLYFWEPFSL